MFATYMQQKLLGTIAAVFAISMHYPLFVFSQSNIAMTTAFILVAVLGIMLSVGVYGLVGGTADQSVRASVLTGTCAAWILVALSPLSWLAALFNQSFEHWPSWVALFVIGIATLIAYFRRAKKYWTHVRSVA